MKRRFTDLGRCMGVLLHPTSLPEATLGRSAYRFVDFLAASGCRVWQVLPLGPTHDDGSPYASLSAFAGNPLLIDQQLLRDQGWLEAEGSDNDMTACALAGFRQSASETDRRRYRDFCEQQRYWLDSFTHYLALRRGQNNQCWWLWPEALKTPSSAEQSVATGAIEQIQEQIRFEQFLFFDQWCNLTAYAARKGVAMIGDLPFFVDRDSADVWSHREQYLLDAAGDPTVVAGVPPDYFSDTGQHWGNPHYDWECLKNRGYEWWRQRLAHQLILQDLVRIDHFRGFSSVWQIPANAETAIEGHWSAVPGDELLASFRVDRRIGHLIAEDLGQITPDVIALRHKYHIPGVRVIQFAFDGGDDNPHRPMNHEEKSVVYTGTHDNDTTSGWWQSLTEEQHQLIAHTVGDCQDSMPWPFIKYAARSRAQVAIFPLQDLLALGSEARMNTPGTVGDNWRWQFRWNQMPENLSERLRSVGVSTNRLTN